MKKTIELKENGKVIERTIDYIPVRYIAAIHIILFEIAAVISAVILLAIYLPYFSVAVLLTQISVAKSMIVQTGMLKDSALRSFFRALIKVFTPLF